MADLVPLKKSDQKFLQKEIVDLRSIPSYGRYRSSALPYLENPDPVLLYLAMQDERAYRTMERNNTAVGQARQVRDNNLLSAGSSIQIGSSKSREAKNLKQLAIALVKEIKAFPEVQKKLTDALYWGWRPMEKVYRPFSFGRKTFLSPYRIIDKDPEHFRFTPDGFLCYIDRFNATVTVFDGDEAPYKWVIATYGSIDNPHGNGVFQKAWMIHFARDKFFEMFAQGMQRSMGVLKLKQGFNHPVGDVQGAATVEPGNTETIVNNVANQVQSIINKFNAENVLVEKMGWTVEFLNNINFADGWIKALEYVDDQITTIIATESLSFQQSEFGSRAQAVVHAESGNKTAKIDGKFLDEWFNEQILRPALELNVGQIDPEDMPKMLSHARVPLDMNQIKQASDMGMEFDADEIARRFNLPMADDDTINRIGGKPVTTPGPPKQDVSKDPGKQVQKADEATRKK
jgi:hypothetical protein